MARIFIGVGSNIAPKMHIACALEQLCAAMRVTDVSTWYRTPALGDAGQPNFINGVVAAETNEPPRTVKFTILHGIEAALGRKRGMDRYAPRTIDLDLLWYDALVVDEPDLHLPDPDIASRAFLAIPLCELAPDLSLNGIALPELAAALDDAAMEPMPELTQALRRIANMKGPE